MAKTLKGFERRRQRARTALKKYNHTGRLRLSVHRSSKHIYAQLIDDKASITIAAASTLDKDLKTLKSSTVSAAEKVGELLAKRALAANVDHVVFDRGGFIFHGRIKAVADGARAAGLKF